VVHAVVHPTDVGRVLLSVAQLIPVIVDPGGSHGQATAIA
jgi:hypothetical protein